MEQKKIKRRIQAYLWEFLVGLLEDEECAPFINWTNKFEKEFVVVDPDEVASLWGLLKNRPNMNKTKLRRAIRQYYKRDLIMKVGVCLCSVLCIHERRNRPWRARETRGYLHKLNLLRACAIFCANKIFISRSLHVGDTKVNACVFILWCLDSILEFLSRFMRKVFWISVLHLWQYSDVSVLVGRRPKQSSCNKKILGKTSRVFYTHCIRECCAMLEG